MSGHAPAIWPERQEPLLYHDMLSPQELLVVRAEVRSFCERVVAPRARQIGEGPDSVEHFPHDVFKAMGEAGLFRIPFGADVGGRGLQFPAAATAAVIEELSYYSSSVGAIYDVHLKGSGPTAFACARRPYCFAPQ